MTYTCECGITVDREAGHPKILIPMTEEVLSMELKVRCSGCDSSISLKTIKEQGIENWSYMRTTRVVFCKHCTHDFQHSLHTDD